MKILSESQIILVVDDNPTNLEVLSQTLSAGGFHVAVAMDGESAIEQVEYCQPNLILLDIMMPGVDGFETCHRLKANPKSHEIPIIFMTALSETEYKVKGLNAGAVDYITKPFQHEEVLARVGVHLQIGNLTRQLETQNAALKQFNESLEQKVADRTRELELSQMKLIQQERLSALGQLVAGVAHEINNPINFIYGNLSPAQTYIQDLFGLLKLYHEHYPNPVTPIQEQIREIDLDFLCLDLPKLIKSMELGAVRIREIVMSLRNFSRLDEAEFKPVDIHAGIESTLMILGHRLKAKPDLPEIRLIKQYGDLPLISCFPGQLNQVLMNLLVNAIDALEMGKIAAPELGICTELFDQDWVRIRISDNGTGISEAAQKKIFDPFFTTKPIGKGTGLGLSISYQIVVEKHQGHLSVDSTLGRGTEFVIEIPVSQPEQGT